MTIQYHLDENVDHAVAHGLRLRGIDVTTSTDARLIGATDEEQLAFAATEGRVLVTHDSDHLRLHHEGASHCGIVYAHPRRCSIGRLVLALADWWRSRTLDEMRQHIEFL